MKKLLMGALVAASVISVSTAEAAIITLTPGTSFTGTIASPLSGQPLCATCSAEVTFALAADGKSLVLTVENTSTDGVAGLNILTAIGFDATPDLTLADTTVAFSGGFATDWSVVDTGGGLGGLGFDLIAKAKGVKPGLDGGDTGVAVFSFDAVASLTIESSAVHFQALLGGGSTKFGCCEEGEGSGEGEGGGGEGEGSGEGEGAVPEPASLLLLGLGLSGAAARMVRKNRA